MKNLEHVLQMVREEENREEGQGNRKRRKKEEKLVSREDTFSLAAYGAACSSMKDQMKLRASQ